MNDAPARTRLTRRGLFAVGGSALAVSACGLRPEPATELSFLVAADSTINPNEDGEPSPVLLRIYDLKSPSAFQQATLFELLDDDAGRLGADMLNRREVEVKPGDDETFEREASAETRYIGVIAAFRNIENATWRTMTQVEPHEETQVQVVLSGTTVQIDSRRVRFGRLSVF